MSALENETFPPKSMARPLHGSFKKAFHPSRAVCVSGESNARLKLVATNLDPETRVAEQKAARAVVICGRFGEKHLSAGLRGGRDLLPGSRKQLSFPKEGIGNVQNHREDAYAGPSDRGLQFANDGANRDL